MTWKENRQRLAVWLKRPLTCPYLTVARRLAIRLLILLPFAALPLPQTSFLRMFVALTGFNVMFSFRFFCVRSSTHLCSTIMTVREWPLFA